MGLHTLAHALALFHAHTAAQRKTTLDARIDIINQFLTAFEAEKDAIGQEITTEMGR